MDRRNFRKTQKVELVELKNLLDGLSLRAGPKSENRRCLVDDPICEVPSNGESDERPDAIGKTGSELEWDGGNGRDTRHLPIELEEAAVELEEMAAALEGMVVELEEMAVPTKGVTSCSPIASRDDTLVGAREAGTVYSFVRPERNGND
jgi:hypothetical protein